MAFSGVKVDKDYQPLEFQGPSAFEGPFGVSPMLKRTSFLVTLRAILEALLPCGIVFHSLSSTTVAAPQPSTLFLGSEQEDQPKNV